MFDAVIINTIKEHLESDGQTIAVAESVTAGLLQAALASAEEATKIFQGGITAYNVGQKCRHLDVNPIHALSCNCVSEQMAKDMAASVSKMFTSDWGVGVTGYATPVPESGNQVYAYAGVFRNGTAVHTARIEAGNKLALDAQLYYVQVILETLAGILQHEKRR